MTDKLIRFCLENKLVVMLMALGMIVWGIMVAPFDWKIEFLERKPVPVDAIPDIGENQQIVFTDWPGRSPQDIEDQITYPLTTALQGLPSVKTVRSYSMFGFSSIYIIFKEDVDFYWSRSRILEKLNSLPAGTLPEGVAPRLGPDATGLGQVFWYTLEGRDEAENPIGGWDLDELRSIQDWYVRYALQGVDGVAEVASIGGFVREYQVDVDPDALRNYNVSLDAVKMAVKQSNLDVGARTLEQNGVEYVIRGLGFIDDLDDLRKTVVTSRGNIPITLEQVADIRTGPAMRRGALDKSGAEAVGGVVVTRYGENPLAVIDRVKQRIEEISGGLPKKTLADGTVSQVTIVPFYDRSGLILETLGTLEEAVSLEILVTIIVVVLMVMHLRGALLISGVLPLAVLFAFIGMKLFHVDANIVALSGIAIAIGTIVDMGIVMIENILKHLEAERLNVSRNGEREMGGQGEVGTNQTLPVTDSPNLPISTNPPVSPSPHLPLSNTLEIVYRACTEVGGAVLTAVLTTVISFLPVFTMQAAEGKLFKPLAYTKTFALIGSIVVALTLIPPLAHWLVAGKFKRPKFTLPKKALVVFNVLVAFVVAVLLAKAWEPFGPEKGFSNIAFVIISVGGLLLPMLAFIWFYPKILPWVLRFKWAFLACATCVILFGFSVWLGFGKLTAWMPNFVKQSAPYSALAHAVPGLGKEFMPSLDEGSFLFMPTTMPHASIGEAMDSMRLQDMAITAIPEVESAVGKLGRVDSALDPAPVSMFETIITYKSEYITDTSGRVKTFAWDKKTGEFKRDEQGELIPDDGGRPFRQWRDEIQSPDDIWNEIVKVTKVPGTTSAPKLQPIAARIVMLQSGMRAPMGLKVYGPDLETIEKTALDIEALLKQVPAVKADTVLADRIVGKPYLEIEIDRDAIARYGVSIQAVQDIIEVAVGGKPLTMTVEGRERYPVRVRYQRELRDSIEALEEVLVAAPDGTQVPLRELADIKYTRGPQMIKSEDTFLVGYVIFDKVKGVAEVDAVEQAQAFLKLKTENGELKIPPGVSYKFTGSYENQIRAAKRLALVLPISLFAIFLILYFQFKKVPVTLLVFSGIAFAWSGGFILLWLYGQDWFLNFPVAGENLRDLFQMGTINLSVAVWVGFLALFGIATDDGVIMATYLEQRFAGESPKTREEVRQLVVEAASRRVRPAMMTIATTILALLPVLTSSGRGSDVMIPMAIPSFGGMCLAVVTVFVVPTLYCILKERRVK